MADLLRLEREGIFCEAADAYLDPSRAVDTALVSHAHSDHARRASKHYYCAASCAPLLRVRLGSNARITGVPFGERFPLSDAMISFHPAGHMLGSAQIRIETRGEVWVYTGDYKRDADPSCEPFELVRCDTLVTEATFSLPIYRWPDPGSVFDDLLAWWDACAAVGKNAVLTAYSSGKTQRVLAELSARTDRRAIVHDAAVPYTEAYREAGVRMLECVPLSSIENPVSGELVIAPANADLPEALFGGFETAFASGWMAVRKRRLASGVDRGFVLSDHIDWPGLLATIEESGAKRIFVTHGDGETVSRFLRERGYDARPLEEA